MLNPESNGFFMELKNTKDAIREFCGSSDTISQKMCKMKLDQYDAMLEVASNHLASLTSTDKMLRYKKRVNDITDTYY